MKKKQLTLKTGENFTVRIPKLVTRIKFAFQLIFKGQFTTNFYNLWNNKKLEHTCGSWPDPTWTKKDFEVKGKACKKCPVCNPININSKK